MSKPVLGLDVKSSDGDSTHCSDSSKLVKEQRLMRKIDFRVLPVLCVLYTMTFLDRYLLLNGQLSLKTFNSSE